MREVSTGAQHLGHALQVNVRRFVHTAHDVADRAEVDDGRAMDLHELVRIQLREQLLEGTLTTASLTAPSSFRQATTVYLLSACR